MISHPLTIDVTNPSAINTTMTPRLLLALSLFINVLGIQAAAEEDRIPFYEDYFKKSDLNGFLRKARQFLKEKPDAIEGPRLAMDFLMAAKVARNSEAVNEAVGYLLFRYSTSLPTLHYLSTFEKGSSNQADFSDLSSKDFAVAYCRTIILIARAKNPELLKDSGLRLRAYLLAVKAEVEEIEKIASQSLSKDSEKDSNLGKAIKIALSEKPVIEKIQALGELKGQDAGFCIKFYLAQLTEEQKKSPEVLALHKGGSVGDALEIFALLPAKTSKLAKYQTFLAFAQHLDGNDKDAIKTLKKISTKSSDKEIAEWGKTAQSYADGLQSSDNRKKLLLKALGKAIDRMNEEKDAFFIKINWVSGAETEKPEQYHAYLSLSKSNESFEIQIFTGDRLTFAFRTDPKKAAIIPPGGDTIISFQSSGALPVPQFDIVRDIGDGSFSYNFNLGFASTFAKLGDEGSRFLKNPYVGTDKGREVLINYVLENKPIWLKPAKSIKGGTSYPISSIGPDEPSPTAANLAFDVTGNLMSLSFGDISFSTILRGDAEILEKMPAWPEKPKREEEKFDFALFMEMINQLSSATSSPN
jgi:hypothetical protein